MKTAAPDHGTSLVTTPPIAIPDSPNHRKYDAGAGSILRGIPLMPLTFLWAVSVAMLVPITAIVAPKWFKKHGWSIPRIWGSAPLWWHGVKVEVTGEENLNFEGARILLFNHVSLLDMLVLAKTCPEFSIVIYKEEFHKIPGVGAALRGLGSIAVNRKNHKAALASMKLAAERIRDNGETVVMAPEGTRSRKGGLQKFKKGPFHLAIQTGAPVVPFIMRGVDQVLPMGSVWMRPGRVALDILPPISSEGWQQETIRDHAQGVREVFLEYLEPEAE
ncbi:MAG: 1-acyl-sn-glycerol-3-phosphate acyltransferase [Planctomycetota bacterium]|nr:1-acyl-sn-glycerol-3-phosphate acyltransferase [Planctomycetota bacterium]MDG2144842.1 1-acyl-sn-glycerol-3-phosphate acyltransferase [Planctomycetota bacterium]